MNLLPAAIRNSPLLARVTPFVVFLALTTAQDVFGGAGRYWLYLIKTLVGAWMLWSLRAALPEMRWRFSLEAVLAGVAVFALWVGVSGEWTTQQSLWAKLGLVSAPAAPPKSWNPQVYFGEGSGLAWLFVAVRIAGTVLVVPPLEEVFYRSFVYRYLTNPKFETVPLGRFLPKPFVLTALIFGFAHNEWLAGILCACAYQGLVIRRQRLGDAMAAHAITNLLLGLWVFTRGAWHFW
jgi:hypothetical protein